MYKLKLGKIVVKYGGTFDATKVVAPFIFRINKNLFRLFYIGTGCKPEERKGYRILSATSKDGINFKKQEKVVILAEKADTKQYSPCLIRFNSRYFLYYALSESGLYKIFYSEARNTTHFKNGKPVKLFLKSDYSTHTPRFVIDKSVFHCYFAASKSNKKIFSKKYPKYDFAEKFRIWHSVSKDGKNFKSLVPIKIQGRFVNIYGHSVLYKNEQIYLFFTKSSDFVNFSKPIEIIKPDVKKNELGVYSCSLLKLNKKTYRIYYGVRYFNNHWNIKSATIEL